MKPKPLSSSNYFTRPVILDDILTPVIHDCIDSKRIVLIVWTHKEGISAIASGNEGCPENV